MIRGLIFLAILLSSAATASAQLVMGSWPDDIGALPCDVWAKNSDGSWTLIKPVEMASLDPNRPRIKIIGITIQKSAEAATIDQSCGAK